MMKEDIRAFITQFVRNYQNREEIATEYGQPLVGFADANHPFIQSLPDLIQQILLTIFQKVTADDKSDGIDPGETMLER